MAPASNMTGDEPDDSAIIAATVLELAIDAVFPALLSNGPLSPNLSDAGALPRNSDAELIAKSALDSVLDAVLHVMGSPPGHSEMRECAMPNSRSNEHLSSPTAPLKLPALAASTMSEDGLSNPNVVPVISLSWPKVSNSRLSGLPASLPARTSTFDNYQHNPAARLLLAADYAADSIQSAYDTAEIIQSAYDAAESIQSAHDAAESIQSAAAEGIQLELVQPARYSVPSSPSVISDDNLSSPPPGDGNDEELDSQNSVLAALEADAPYFRAEVVFSFSAQFRSFVR